MARQIIDSESMDEFERQMDRMVHTFFPHEHRTQPHLWRPAMDMYETEDTVVVKVEAAGMNADDFTISFVNRILIIRGVRQDVEEKHIVHRLEIPYGEFQIEVRLAEALDGNQIEAKYEQGFLYVTMPKSKQEHRIPIRVQSNPES